jgi:tetratricopeptide (TPR) repeat protein
MKTSRPFIIFVIIVVLIATAFGVVFCFVGEKKPASERPIDEIAAAWLDFRMGEYNQAILKFQKAVDGSADNSEQRIQALYGLACTQWLKQLPYGDKNAATLYFKEIITKSPDSEYAAWSMLALVRMRHIVPSGTTPDYPDVRKGYKEIYDKFSGHTAGHEAFIYMIGTYLAMFTREDAEFAKTRLDEFIIKHPDSPFISSAWGLYAKACETLGKRQEQLDALLKELEKREIDPKNPKMDNSNAYWAIATVAEFETGDFDTARKYYRRMISEYPQEKRNFTAKKAIERMDLIEEKMRAEN